MGFSLRWLLLLCSPESRALGLSRCGSPGSGAQSQQLWSPGSGTQAQQLWSPGSGAQAQQLWVPRLWSTGSVVVPHGLSCSAACGIFPDQGSNLCLLRWQVDSPPLSLQGSPLTCFKKKKIALYCNPPGNTFSLEEEDWVGRMLLQGECGRRGALWGEGLSCRDCLKNLE